MSLKSRVFAILDARRPELGSDLGNKLMVETKRPSWTPPGFVFPIGIDREHILHTSFALAMMHLFMVSRILFRSRIICAHKI